ncbi:MAG: type II toxin-antitoxin system RelE/ParE family toxin [Rothia sp. (in: high G+C Gram-positive bacteria)]|uniref:type II toxin-antitoxin system RelE family toxin n=1 Tax=Rothia sp. (in: high G+C Gram-positive bacteria) TaxID=1885016 RepID=UPI0026DEF2F0|nr:type II toxin-antitoxin system RelE/ParE family toxin [Rothia sp. (in: high G+C Gram-positive bacteria)]MDO5750712.1 type II toxin-antitoxin system RelE/ParE family toxin [Rothia sp. (in: high G+C Gram-positive bacteria)]
MTWTIKFTSSFAKELKRLDKPTRLRILKYFDDLQTIEDPRVRGKGLTGNLSGYWRYRIGDYRVVVELIDNQLVILAIDLGHRREIYKRY